MSDLDSQSEEREVLLSIYDGDSCFKEICPTVYQYKYGVDNDPKSFLLEIIWTETYPTDKPQINMDTFYNKHVMSEVKEKIMQAVMTEAEQYLGAAMTYTLFEFVKERQQELTEDQPDAAAYSDQSTGISSLQINDEETMLKKSPKKEHLTKAQKRRQWDKVDSKGEKPRGWNWMDVVKHLSQTGQKNSPEVEVPSYSTG